MSSRSDTQPSWHLTNRLGSSPSVTLRFSNGQTQLTCASGNLFTQALIVPCPLRCSDHTVIDCDVWTFFILGTKPCRGVKFFRHSEEYFLLRLSILPFPPPPLPPPLLFTRLHCSGRQSSLVLSSHLLFAHPSSSPRGIINAWPGCSHLSHTTLRGSTNRSSSIMTCRPCRKAP